MRRVFFHSEVGDLLCQQSSSFALMWTLDRKGQVKCGLRSRSRLQLYRAGAEHGRGRARPGCAFRMPYQRLAGAAGWHVERVSARVLTPDAKQLRQWRGFHRTVVADHFTRAPVFGQHMNGTESTPSETSNCVLALTACSSSGAMLLDADMPPVPASSDVSCAVMASTGLAADIKAAACARLLPALKAMGTQTNLTLLCRGSEAFQRWPQCGHCGSNNTYTGCALISAPTVNPLAVAATVS
jgi:hypothetical protein